MSGSIDFYHIDEKYIAFLNTKDYRVQYNKFEHRPYIGIVLKIGGFDYFAPLESPKPNHQNINGGGPVMKIDNGNLGIIGFNNMVPVKSINLKQFDINALTDQKYQNLLINQLVWCRKNRGDIYARAEATYQKETGGNITFYKRICCDFKKLEYWCQKYNPFYRKKK